jgi:LuxR family maltose regulon positive regulatory protein
LTAGLFDRAIQCIEKFIEIHDITGFRTLNRWLGRIPAELVLAHPVVCFAFAQVILYTTDRFAPATTVRIEPMLSAAETAWEAQENHQGLGEVLSFRGMAAWWQGDFQKAFEYAHRSLDELPEYDVLYRGTSLLTVSYEGLSAGRILAAQDRALEARALLGAAQNIFGVLAAIQILAEIFYWQGEFEPAEQLNQQILVEAVGDESMLDDQGIASLGLAHIAYERNDLEEAERFAVRALDAGDQRGNEFLRVQATIRLAHIHSGKGDPLHARELLKALEAKIQNPALLREIHCAQALISIRAKDDPALDWWVGIISAEDQGARHLQQEREAFTLARLRIAQGKPREALEALRGWRLDSAVNGRVRSQVRAMCLEALGYYTAGSLPEAHMPLIEALRLGQGRGFRRTFIDEGEQMAALIQAALPGLPNRTLTLFAGTLLRSFP